MRQNKSDPSFILKHIGNPISKRNPRVITCASFLASLTLSFGLTADPYNSNSLTGETAPESFESYQMRILKNQNQLQAEKIQTLRGELVEINQKLNELKPHLFKYGDPENEARIAELNYQLSEKERVIHELTQAKAYLQAEMHSIQKKMQEMEIVKDALTSMVEAHRNAKEQNLTQFMKQLNEINTAAENNRTELEKKIGDHQSHAEKLQQQISDKEHTIRRLDTLAGHLNTLVSKKEHELDQLKGHVMSLYDEHLLVAEHQHDTTQKEQEKFDKTLQDWQWQLDSLQSMNGVLLNEIDKLEAALEQEKINYLDGMQQHHQASANSQAVLLAHIQSLQEDLNKEIIKNIGPTKEKLNTLNNAYLNLEAEMYEHVHVLTSALVQERAQTREIGQALTALHIHHEAGEIHSESLNTELQKALAELDKQEKLQAWLSNALNSLQEDFVLQGKLEDLSLMSQNLWMATENYKFGKIEEEQKKVYALLTGIIRNLRSSLQEEIALSTHLRIILEDYVNLADNLSNQRFLKQLAMLQEEHDNNENQLKENNAQLKQEMESKTAQLEQEIKNKAAELDLTENELGHMIGLYQMFHDLHLDMGNKTNNLKKDLNHYSEAIAWLNEQEEKMSLDLQEKTQALSLLEDKLNTLDSHNNSLSAENEELKTHHDYLLDEIQKHEIDKSDLAKQIDQLYSRLVHAETLIADMGTIDLSDLVESRHSNTSQDLHHQIQYLEAELESSKSRNSALEKDLAHARMNYTRERNNNYNLEKILTEIASTSAKKEPLSDPLLHDYAFLQDYVKYLEERQSHLSESDYDSEKENLDLPEKYKELQDHAAELSIQLLNLSHILREKDRAQAISEINAEKAQKKNRELTAEQQRLAQ